MESYDDEELAEIARNGELSDFWWCADEEMIADRAMERVRGIVSRNSTIYAAMRDFALMYDGRAPIWYDDDGRISNYIPIGGMGGGTSATSATGVNPRQNLFATCIDAMASIIAKQRPMPRVLTHGGDWSAHRISRIMNDGIKGQLPDSGLYGVAPEVCIDALFCGTGVMRVIEDKKDIRFSRVIPWNLVVDPETVDDTGCPDEVFLRQAINVKKLIKLHPELKAQILECSRLSGTSGANRQVVVYEGWYDGGDEGVYVKFLDGLLLEIKDWTGRKIPLEYLMYQKPRTGFYGIGLAEKLLSQQIRIDEIELFIAEMQRRHMRPTCFVPQGTSQSKIVSITGLEMDVVEMPGSQPPVISVPSPVHPDLYRQVDRIVDRSMQETGISDFATNSKLPSGIESGPAVREVSFKNMDRHNQFATQYEELFISAGHHLIDGLCRIAASKRGVHEVFYKRKGSLGKVEWPKDLKKDGLKYVLSVEASTLDTLSPSFRTQTVLEWAQQGLLSGPAEVRQLLGNPDLEESDRYSMATHEDEALFIIDELSQGNRVFPDQYMDLPIIVPKVQAAMSVARQMKIPDKEPEVYQAFTIFMDEALVLQSARMQPAMDDGMPIPNVSRAAAQGLDTPLSGGGSSSQGI